MKSAAHTILVVEDDPRDVELTLMALGEYDLKSKVEVVCDGAEVLDYLYCRGKYGKRATGNPLVVLLDLKMPKVNGLEVLRIIKADVQLKIIPVVVLSSSREKSDLTTCYQYGVNAYVVKPVDFAEFMKVVRHLSFFWTEINEPPPQTGRKETLLQENESHLFKKKKADHEIDALPPASGG